MLLVGGGRVALDGRHRQALQVPHLGLDPRRVGGWLLHHRDAVAVARLDLERDAGQSRGQRCYDAQEVRELHPAEFEVDTGLPSVTRSSADRGARNSRSHLSYGHGPYLTFRLLFDAWIYR